MGSSASKPNCAPVSATLTSSVIIRTRNEAHSISRALSCVDQQTHSPKEIIVVDSGSTDGTPDRIAGFAGISQCAVKIVRIHPEEFSFGFSANAGAAAASGDILVYVSAHAFPRNNHWLEELTVPFLKNPRLAGVSGAQNGKPVGLVNDQCSSLIIDEEYFQNNWSSFFQSHYYCPGLHLANSAIRRDVWLRSPFNSLLSGLEEKEWSKRVLAAGYQICLLRAADVQHVHSESPWRKFIRSFREHRAAWKFLPIQYNERDLFSEVALLLKRRRRKHSTTSPKDSLIYLAGKYIGLQYDAFPLVLSRLITRELLKIHPVESFMRTILHIQDALQGRKNISWAVVGSYSLWLQGFITGQFPRDIDILVDSEQTLSLLESKLQPYITRERIRTLEKGGEQTQFKIHGVLVEIFYALDDRLQCKRWLQDCITLEVRRRNIPCISVKGELEIRKALITIRGKKAGEEDKIRSLEHHLEKDRK